MTFLLDSDTVASGARRREVGGEMEARYRAEGASPPLRRVEEAAAYGTVMVVPSPVALTVNVPAAAFGTYAYEVLQAGLPPGGGAGTEPMKGPDRKSTRLNSSHSSISYA